MPQEPEYRDQFSPSKRVVALERSGELCTPTPEGRTIEQNEAIHAQAQQKDKNPCKRYKQ